MAHFHIQTGQRQSVQDTRILQDSHAFPRMASSTAYRHTVGETATVNSLSYTRVLFFSIAPEYCTSIIVLLYFLFSLFSFLLFLHYAAVTCFGSSTSRTIVRNTINGTQLEILKDTRYDIQNLLDMLSWLYWRYSAPALCIPPLLAGEG